MNNTFGRFFTFTSFGESHGFSVGCVVNGCPSGIPYSLNDIQFDLNRRMPGVTRYVTPRFESDSVNVVSGIFNNKTTGTPIAIIVNNKNYNSKDYNNISFLFRPGHADISYYFKYKNRDPNGGGRSSARTTIAFVVAGGFARKILSFYFNVKVFGFLNSIFNYKFNFLLTDFFDNYYNINNIEINKLEKKLDLIRSNKNSCGAKISLIIFNSISGLGDPLYNKLESVLCSALMGLNAVKSIEVGNGKLCSYLNGIVCNDLIRETGFLKNSAGGILGGITSGQDINLSIYIKPTSSVSKFQKSIDSNILNNDIFVKGRHDPCVGIRAVPIIESIASIVLLNFIISQRLNIFI